MVTESAIPRVDYRARGQRSARSFDPYVVVPVMIAVVQAAWLAALASRGWFYQDDFTFTFQASHRRLGWAYLTDPVNEHLTPGLRLQFWFFRHAIPLDYGATIAYRAVLQIVCTVLLGRLLVYLFGRRRFVLVALTLYAFNPLIVPGFMWLASATNLLPSQALAIFAVHTHVRYVRDGRLRDAVCCGVSLLGVALFWEKAATIAVVLPVLTLGFLLGGPVPRRLRGLAGMWRGLAMEYLPLAVFSAYFFAAGYGSSSVAGGPGVGKTLNLITDAWTHTFAPAIIGGPWRWYSVPVVYVSAGNATTLAVVVAQACFVVVAALGVVRLGPRSLLAWTLPAVSIVLGSTLVSLGRYRELGGLLTRVYAYSYDVGLPLLLGVCLALVPTVDERAAGTVAEHRLLKGDRRWQLATAAVMIVVLGGSVFSTLRFVDRWAENPARTYFARLEQSVKQLPPGSSIYDTPASERVLPFFNPVRHLSDLLPLAGLHPAYNGPNQEPLFVRDDAKIVRSVFIPAATALPTSENSFCQRLVQGAQPLELSLNRLPGQNQWFLRIEYFRQVFATMRIRVVDQNGSVMSPVGGSEVAFDSAIGIVTVRLPVMNPSKLIFVPETPATNVCITSATVGSPFAATS